MDTSQLTNTTNWGPYKEEILSLYFDEDLGLSQVSQHMREKYGLRKTYVSLSDEIEAAVY